MKPRVYRFRVADPGGRARRATVTVSQTGAAAAVMTVRRYGSRRVLTLDLGALVRGALYAELRRQHPIHAGSLMPHETSVRKKRRSDT